MVVKQHILNNINKLERLYNSAPTPEATYYSKLAIIELCGWIESTMDNIAENYASRKLRTASFQSNFREIKRRNYGFDYNENFKKMMNQIIGMYNMENIEIPLVATGEKLVLESTLENLKRLRNSAAHTFINATTTYQAPSVTKSQLLQIYPILKKISKEVKAL